MVTILISAAFRGAAFIRGEVLIREPGEARRLREEIRYLNLNKSHSREFYIK